MSEHEPEADPERRLREVMDALDQLPPDLVADAIRERGLLDKALDVLRDLALHSSDPEIRADARRSLEERGLSIVLWAEEDDSDDLAS